MVVFRTPASKNSVSSGTTRGDLVLYESTLYPVKTPFGL